MPSIVRAIRYLTHNRSQFLDSCIKNLDFLFSDKLYISLRYRFIMGHWINWGNPLSFTEKIQWLKIYDYKSEYTKLVDKYTVKDYISLHIGEEYIIPTIGVWNNVSEIVWESLPEQFVLKTTHGGGGCGVVVCKDKSTFDKTHAIAKLSKSMSGIVGKEFRERIYYHVPRKIIAEKYVEPQNMELKDYKFFCSNGNVICFKVDFGRFVEHHANYYDCRGSLLPFGEVGLEPDYDHEEIFPNNLHEMISIASKLSKGFKFLRVDLYNVDGKIYFGELTLYPGSGLIPLTSAHWDLKIGKQIDLSV